MLLDTNKRFTGDCLPMTWAKRRRCAS